MLVLDASFSMPLFVADPRRPQIVATVRKLREEGHTFLAPTLWMYEITSTVQKLCHFGHISASEAESALALMADFAIELAQPDFRLARRALDWSRRLNRASAYDSFYLALAEERGCDLWTADSRLANAVKERWVRLLA